MKSRRWQCLTAAAVIGTGLWAAPSVAAGDARGQGVCTVPASIPPASGGGVCHQLKTGQTLFSLAKAYGVPLAKLVETNGIEDPSRIQAGRTLFIPGASAPLKVAPSFPLHLSWPLTGMVTSAFGSQGTREHHEGIDIDGVKGQPVHAAAAGRVIWVGTERGYGNMVVIDHGEGWSTLYAHASRLLVGADEWVGAGEAIAEVGDTGNARGAHLHFEVHRSGLPVNPLPLLGTGIARASGRP